tara:strand:+ start:6116 stop:7318 length:1203 start_codon:yes stop_codon:yes gene_type:complete
MENNDLFDYNVDDKKKFEPINLRLSRINELSDNNYISSMIDSCRLDNSTCLTTQEDIRELLPKKHLDFNKVINKLGGKLLYIKSGSTGHTFKGVHLKKTSKTNYGVKVVAYPKKEHYGGMYMTNRPENAELLMIQLLSQFVKTKQTPHVVLPITTFNTTIKTFTNLAKEDIVDNKKYDQFIKRYKKGEYYDKVSILISEWANNGDLLDYLRKNYKNLGLKEWRVLLFQIISVLAIIQAKYPSFRHNDMKANNILIHKIGKNKISKFNKYQYKINGQKYIIPNIGYQIKLWDFDFSTIPGLIDNSKVEAEWTTKINISPVKNRYYDIHYFLNTLTRKGFFPEFWKDDNVPKKIREFFLRIVPEKYRKGDNVSERGRILVAEEYITPDEILKSDPLFKIMRL